MIERDFSAVRHVGDLILTAKIPPYVWMYNRGRIDIDVYDQHGGNRRYNTPFEMENSSNDDLVYFLNTIAVEEVKCKTCEEPMMRRESEYRLWNECEKCCLAKIDAEWKIEEAKIRKEEEKEEHEMFCDGFRWKVDAWVHPSRGDDYMVRFFSEIKPTDAQVKAMLKKKRSRVETDYRIVELKCPAVNKDLLPEHLKHLGE